jgi:hypothetical protein
LRVAAERTGSPTVVRAAVITLAAALLTATLAQRDERVSFPLPGDGHYYVIQAISLLFEGDLDFRNQYATFGDPFDNARMEVTRGIGNTLLWAPFAYLGVGVSALAGARSLVESAGALVWGFRAGTLFYGLFGLALVWLNPRMSAGSALSRAAVLVAITAGTPFLTYTLHGYLPLYPHVPIFFLVAALWYLIETAPVIETPRRRPFQTRAWSVWLGMVLGTLLTSRPEFVALGLLLLWPLDSLRTRLPALLSAGMLASAIYGLQAILFAVWEKSAVPHPEFMRYGAGNILEALHAPRNGFLFQQPLILLGFYALILAQARTPRGVALVLAFALVLMVNGAPWDPWGGWSVGCRRLIPLLPFAGWGLAIAWSAASRWMSRLSARDLPRQAAEIILAALVAAGTVYGYSALSYARADAVQRAAVPAERRAVRVIGKLTASPILLPILLTAPVDLGQAYRIAWRQVLFAPINRRSATDRIVAGSARFADLLIDETQTATKRCYTFLLPLHRTPLRRIGVHLDHSGPVAILVDAQAAVSVPGTGGAALFEAPGAISDRLVRLDVILDSSSRLRALTLYGSRVTR